MNEINLERWTNPLTGSDTVPEHPGEILTAAVAYWEDVLTVWRNRRPRKPADRTEKLDMLERATDRLNRYRTTRDAYASNPKRTNKLTIQLATDDLRAVMGAGTQRSAA